MTVCFGMFCQCSHGKLTKGFFAPLTCSTCKGMRLGYGYVTVCLQCVGIDGLMGGEIMRVATLYPPDSSRRSATVPPSVHASVVTRRILVMVCRSDVGKRFCHGRGSSELARCRCRFQALPVTPCWIRQLRLSVAEILASPGRSALLQIRDQCHHVPYFTQRPRASRSDRNF